MKKKIGIALFIILFLLSNIAVYAKGDVIDISDVIKPGYHPTNIDSKLNAIRGNAIAVVEVIGVSIASVMLIGLGIKYMLSAPNERAEVKKHMIPFVVGAIFIFASVGIIEIIKQFAENMFIRG